MSTRALHIVSFAIPDPPNYGGVIDVFYKVKALSQKGIEIHLHCFQYDNRERSTPLESMCSTVNYFRRDTSWRKAIGTTPYIIASRYNEQLIRNLNETKAPILFEGMHTSGNAFHPSLRKRMKAIRMHNIEWEYYKQLAKGEKSLFKKLFYKLESGKLANFRSVLKKMNLVLAISEYEQEELGKLDIESKYLPVFHQHCLRFTPFLVYLGEP